MNSIATAKRMEMRQISTGMANSEGIRLSVMPTGITGMAKAADFGRTVERRAVPLESHSVNVFKAQTACICAG